MLKFARRRRAAACACATPAFIAIPLALAFTSAAAAGVGGNIVPDNGSGSAFMPPFGLTYCTVPNLANAGGDMHIVDGLPVGTTIEIDATLGNFSWTFPGTSVQSFPGVQTQFGGTLGGEQHAAGGTLAMPMIGTGTLAGYNRLINVPVELEIHTAPRTPFAPVQAFNTDLFRFFGQITQDPDFALLRIVSGTDFGLPSPGQTTLTQTGPNWAVDSFFDISYRIDFVGSPGGPLAGRSGSTTHFVRLYIPAPGAGALLGLAGLAAVRRRR